MGRVHWNITFLIACTPEALQGVFTKGLGTQIFSEIFMQLRTQSILDLSRWHNWSVNFLLQQLLLILWVFRMSSLFPCRLYYCQWSLLGNVLAVSCERSLQFSNSKCKVSGLAELQDLRKEVQADLGQEPEISNRLHFNCGSAAEMHTLTHMQACMHVCTLRWSWVMAMANISSSFIWLLCQQQLLSGIGDGTVPVFPHQWTCICHDFT